MPLIMEALSVEFKRLAVAASNYGAMVA